MSQPEVVVTGVGALTAAGEGAAALATLLGAGGAAGRPVQMALPVASVAGVPVAVAPHPNFPDDRKAWLALAALEGALAEAGAAEGLPFPGRRVAVFLGTGLSSVTPAELAEDVYPHLISGAQGQPRFDRAAMAADLAADRGAPRRHLPARVTEAVAARVGASGPVGTSFSACAAAAQAIAEGLWALRRGLADVAIVGGHDSMIHPVGLLSFVVLGALSPTVCRPFDQGRDGFLIGEGAAVLVLERRADALARGARPLASLLGAGTSVDAWNVTAPHPEGAGAERAMRRALKDARIPASAVGYINAHGTGTPVGDVAEASAIAAVFGGAVPVSSIKGAVGHTIAAAGAVEAAACIAALNNDFLPGTAGLQDPDPAVPVTVLSAPRRVKGAAVGAVLSNSFGFGGQNASIVLAHPEWEVPLG